MFEICIFYDVMKKQTIKIKQDTNNTNKYKPLIFSDTIRAIRYLIASGVTLKPPRDYK